MQGKTQHIWKQSFKSFVKNHKKPGMTIWASVNKDKRVIQKQIFKFADKTAKRVIDFWDMDHQRVLRVLVDDNFDYNAQFPNEFMKFVHDLGWSPQISPMKWQNYLKHPRVVITNAFWTCQCNQYYLRSSSEKVCLKCITIPQEYNRSNIVMLDVALKKCVDQHNQRVLKEMPTDTMFNC